MSQKLAPPPPIARETMLALLDAASEWAAAKPWELMADCHLVGLTDSKLEEIRLASVLGTGGEVFGAVFYRHAAGLRWILSVTESPEDYMSMDALEGMDCLKVEMVSKRDLAKVELDLLKTLNFKPLGNGLVWPQFQSTTPGWLPWHIDQTEAEQLLADLPCLTRFHELFRHHPDLFKQRSPGEIPMLHNPMPDRPLAETDLEWRTFISSPAPHEPFKVSDQQLTQLRSLERVPKSCYEYGCNITPTSSTLEKGRPCLSRVSLLVEHGRGFVLGFELSLGSEPLSDSAGKGLVNTLVKNGFLPEKILIDDLRLKPILQPFCDDLQIKLFLGDELDFLTEAMDSIGNFLKGS
jgi:hypothetical protein